MFWQQCNDCRLQKNQRVVLPQTPVLKGVPNIVVVGEAPGKEEHEQGTPFVGKAGKMLDKTLKQAGIVRDEIMIANTVLCRPPQNKIQKEELTQCKPIVTHTLTANRVTIPTNNGRGTKEELPVYVAMGGTAIAFFLGEKAKMEGIGRIRGRAQYTTLNGARAVVIPTWHPAYALPGYRVSAQRARENCNQITNDLTIAKQLSDDRKMPLRYTIIHNFESAITYLEKLHGKYVVAYDTETTGLEYDSKLLGVSFTHGTGQGIYIPLWVYDMHSERDGALVRPSGLSNTRTLTRLEDALRNVFADEKIGKIGHNLKFDAGIIRHNLGVWPQGHIFDTMTAAFVENTDPNVDKYKGGRNLALETLISKHCPIILAKKQSLDGIKAALNISQDGYAKVPLRILGQYACGDSDGTFRAAFALERKLKARPKDYKFYTTEIMPMTDALARAQYRGVKIDIELAKQYQVEFDAEVSSTYKKIQTYAQHFGASNFNPRSSKQKRELLQDKLKLPQMGKTATGAFQVDKTAILKWMILPDIDVDVRNFLSLISHYQKVDKLKGTYIDGILKRVHADGCIRTSFNQTGTRTYRLSSSNPNLQNLPRREDEWSKRIKHLFVARPGHMFIGSDLSQAELRVAAVMSGDTKLINAYAQGNDVHALTAQAIFDTSNITQEQRKVGKTVNFAVLYGTTAPTLLSAICYACLLYTSPSPRDRQKSRMPSSA